MNTQYHTTTTVPALPVAEELVDIPSEHITGESDLHSKYTLDAWYLSQFDMQSILEELRDEIKSSSRGDIDGEIYLVDYKVYRIEAVHHFRIECEQRYDVSFGQYEPVETGRVDTLEVVRVTDENGKEYHGQRYRLNDYFKQKKLITMTTIEYSINGKFAGRDKTNRNLTDSEIRKVVRNARREFAPKTIEVTIKRE